VTAPTIAAGFLAVRGAPVSVARLPRHAGLGNALLPLAKAYLTAQALGVPYVRPAWGLNRRPYWRYFSGSRLDVLPLAQAMVGRRRVTFTEAAYRATGVVDYGEAVRLWAENALPDGRSVVVNEGMWGGRPAVDAARPFVLDYLRRSRYAAANQSALLSRRRRTGPLVGMHVRRGDFVRPRAASPPGRSRWNVGVPIDWYRAVGQDLRRRLGHDVEFLVVGQLDDPEVSGLARELDALTTAEERWTDVSDLLLLAGADVLVCSVSSFSLGAAWLGQGVYVWPRWQLVEHDGWLSLWGDQPAQQDGLTAQNRRALTACGTAPAGRGVAAPLDGRLPDGLEALLRERGDCDRRSDLVYYGVVPA
jgi:hypothetical protein